MFLSELDDPAPTGPVDTPETPTSDFALDGRNSRLSRGELDAQLSGILVMELAKVLA